VRERYTGIQREKEGETDREIQTDRLRERQADRQRQKDRDRERKTGTEVDREKQKERGRERQTEREKNVGSGDKKYFAKLLKGDVNIPGMSPLISSLETAANVKKLSEHNLISWCVLLLHTLTH